MHHEVQRTSGRGATALTDDFASVDAITPVTQRSMFWKPLYLSQSDCLEHLPFLFWLVEAVRPRAILEVGNGDPVAYFALCQAVDRLGLDTSCTMMCAEGGGDGHATDFDQIDQHNDTHYAGFSVLMRGDVAGSGLNRLPSQSVDLLLIHGADALSQVNGAFDRWLQKLAPNAIILLAGSIGQDEFTERVKRDYHHFEFVHGHGLLVACRGSEPSALLERIFTATNSSNERQAFRQVFSRLGRSCLDAWMSRHAAQREKGLLAEAQSAQQALQQSQARAQQVLGELQVRGRELTDALAASDQHQRTAQEAAQQLRAKSVEVQNLRQELLLSRQESERLAQHAATLQNELEQQKAMAGESEANHRRASQSLQAQHAVQLTHQGESHQRELTQIRAELAAAQDARLQAERTLVQYRLEVHERAEQQSEQWLKAQTAQQSVHEAETARLLAQFETQQAQAQTQHQNELASLKGELTLRCAELTQFSQQLEEAKLSADGLVAEIAALRSQNEQLQHTQAEKQAFHAAELAELKAQQNLRWTELACLTKALEEERDSSEQKLAGLKTMQAEALQAAQTEAALLTKRITEAYAQMAGLTKQLEERDAHLRHAHAQALSAEQTMASHEDELTRLRIVVEQLQVQLQQTQDKLTERYREISLLTMAVEERDRILVLREQDLEASKNRLAELKDTVSWQLTAPVRALAKPFVKNEKKKRNLMTQVALIEKSGMFDVEWYRTTYPEVQATQMCPVEHYLTAGAAEGKDPSPSFATKWYLAHNEDVARSGVNPLVHYLKFGQIEGRSARPGAQ